MQTDPEISRDRNLFLMYQPKYFSRHMLSVADAVRPDTILYIEPFDAPHYEVAARQVRLTDFPADQFKNSRVFLFDYFSRPISKIAQILYAQGAEIIFVQHGSISHLEVEIQTGAKRIFWKRFWRRLAITVQIARIAAEVGQLRSLVKNPRKLDINLVEAAYVYIEQDASAFQSLGDRCILCQSADSKRFAAQPDAGAVFISQPLIEDGIVEPYSYLTMFDSLVEKHGIARVIAHPRDRVLAKHARDKGIAVSSLQEQGTFPAASIVGHYSTLLYEIIGIEVTRVSHSNGEEIERFIGEDRSGAPLLMDVLRKNYGQQNALAAFA